MLDLQIYGGAIKSSVHKKGSAMPMCCLHAHVWGHLFGLIYWDTVVRMSGCRVPWAAHPWAILNYLYILISNVEQKISPKQNLSYSETDVSKCQPYLT